MKTLTYIDRLSPWKNGGCKMPAGMTGKRNRNKKYNMKKYKFDKLL